MIKHFIQDIDYINNPYFNNTGTKNTFSRADNIKLAELINNVDSVVDYVTLNLKSDAVQHYEKVAKPYLEDIKQLLLERSANDPDLAEKLLAVLSEAKRTIIRHIQILTDNSDFKKYAEPEDENNRFVEKVSAIKEQGFVEFSFDHGADFLEWSSNQLTKAREYYENETDWRGGHSYARESTEFKIIEKFISDNRILEVISEYKKMNMEIYYAAWDYSHHRQKWFRHNHEYDHLSPTNYYHFDADADVAKMLIYLTDVKEGDGAFKFVKGSNIMPRSVFTTNIHAAVDNVISAKYKKEGNLYGRGLFLYGKELLMKFPTCFMGTTHFGDDVIEGSDLSNYLLNNTTTFVRQKGSAILFDGFTGIHAGGNAYTGERLAIQVAFMRKKSIESGRPKIAFNQKVINLARTIPGIIKRKLIGRSS